MSFLLYHSPPLCRFISFSFVFRAIDAQLLKRNIIKNNLNIKFTTFSLHYSIRYELFTIFYVYITCIDQANTISYKSYSLLCTQVSLRDSLTVGNHVRHTLRNEKPALTRVALTRVMS